MLFGIICLKNVVRSLWFVIFFFLGVKIIFFVNIVLGLGVIIMIFLLLFEDFFLCCNLIGLVLVGVICFFEWIVRMIGGIVDCWVGDFVIFSNVLKNLFCFLVSFKFFFIVGVCVMFWNLDCGRKFLVEKLWCN